MFAKLRKSWRNHRLEKAVDIVLSADPTTYSGDKLAVEDTWIATIDQETGELTNHLVKFPDFHTYHSVRKYLKAYYLTNHEFLTPEARAELENLHNNYFI